MTVLGLIGLLSSDLAQVAVPMLSREVIDHLAPGGPPPNSRILWAMVGLAVLAYLSRCLWRYCLFGAARLCDVQIRKELYQRAMGLPMTYHARHTTGHIMTLATSDVSAVRTALAYALMSSFDAIAFGFMSIAAMFYLDAQLALYTLLPFPLMAVLMRITLHWNYALWDRVQQSIDEMTEKARESIAGMRVLRALVQARGDSAQFHGQTEVQRRRFMHFVYVDSLHSPIILLIAGISSTILLTVGGQHVADGRMSVGDFAAFASYLAQLSWPMIAAGWALSLVQRGAASMERILVLLDEPAEPVQASSPDRTYAGRLEVRDLTFGYPGAAEPALDGLSFRLEPGASLGVVGEVGSGKSTMTRLLLRLWEPPAGSIRLDDQPIDAMNLTELRRQVAWVEQESFLFSQSIAENLALGRPLAEHRELEEMARLAELHEEVLSFPQGYDTLLGERGISLSGGQKQRLCLARALLKPAPVLVLDDTLSAVDGETEQRILTALAARRGRQTLLVIAHRVSSVRHLDEILVLERGRVVQRGTHDQLLAQPGLYRQLYELQSR